MGVVRSWRKGLGGIMSVRGVSMMSRGRMMGGVRWWGERSRGKKRGVMNGWERIWRRGGVEGVGLMMRMGKRRSGEWDREE